MEVVSEVSTISSHRPLLSLSISSNLHTKTMVTVSKVSLRPLLQYSRSNLTTRHLPLTSNKHLNPSTLLSNLTNPPSSSSNLLPSRFLPQPSQCCLLTSNKPHSMEEEVVATSTNQQRSCLLKASLNSQPVELAPGSIDSILLTYADENMILILTVIHKLTHMIDHQSRNLSMISLFSSRFFFAFIRR